MVRLMKSLMEQEMLTESTFPYADHAVCLVILFQEFIYKFGICSFCRVIQSFLMLRLN
jgi:hypothetical protein